VESCAFPKKHTDIRRVGRRTDDPLGAPERTEQREFPPPKSKDGFRQAYAYVARRLIDFEFRAASVVYLLASETDARYGLVRVPIREMWYN
jgi:hypothetical protein